LLADSVLGGRRSPETFEGVAVTRDLEKEGVLPASASQSYGSAQFSQTTALIDLQTKHRDLRNRLERIEDILKGLIEKQGASL
jgi:hypothetical protein